MTDAVHVGSLSKQTREAICEYLRAQDNALADHFVWIGFEDACAVWFRLKYAADDPALFPRGKWATLQALEELIQRAMQ